jgi:hypothetical protein
MNKPVVANPAANNEASFFMETGTTLLLFLLFLIML